MPQMAPMYWTILFLLFILSFLMFNMLIYFMYKFDKCILLKNLSINQMICKW